MVDIDVVSGSVREDSILGFALSLVGNARWHENWRSLAPSGLLVVVEPESIDVVARSALRFRSERYRGPFVVISERAEDARVAGWLNAGIDLWLPVDVNGWYLVAAIGALARRSAIPDLDAISPESDKILGNARRPLTRMEWELLRYLRSNCSRWVSKHELSLAVLGHPPRGYDDSTLRVHVCRVRRALGNRRDLVESERQKGWRWAEGRRTNA